MDQPGPVHRLPGGIVRPLDDRQRILYRIGLVGEQIARRGDAAPVGYQRRQRAAWGGADGQAVVGDALGGALEALRRGHELRAPVDLLHHAQVVGGGGGVVQVRPALGAVEEAPAVEDLADRCPPGTRPIAVALLDAGLDALAAGGVARAALTVVERDAEVAVEPVVAALGGVALVEAAEVLHGRVPVAEVGDPCRSIRADAPEGSEDAFAVSHAHDGRAVPRARARDLRRSPRPSRRTSRPEVCHCASTLRQARPHPPAPAPCRRGGSWGRRVVGRPGSRPLRPGGGSKRQRQPRWRLVPRTIVTTLVVLAMAAQVNAQEPVEIGGRLELLVDDYLIESISGEAELQMHRPVRREIVFRTDAPWEGNASAFCSVFRDGDLYRMYYRGLHYRHSGEPAQALEDHPWMLCYVESDDGVHWRRPELGIHEFLGSTANNIVLTPEACAEFGGDPAHTATWLDTNPACPPDERIKITIVCAPKGSAGAPAMAHTSAC